MYPVFPELQAKDIVSINLVQYEAPKGARILHANSIIFPGLDRNSLLSFILEIIILEIIRRGETLKALRCVTLKEDDAMDQKVG